MEHNSFEFTKNPYTVSFLTEKKINDANGNFKKDPNTAKAYGSTS